MGNNNSGGSGPRLNTPTVQRQQSAAVPLLAEAQSIRNNEVITGLHGEKGLDNNAGLHHCFLNVVIQSFWHIHSFREKFIILPHESHRQFQAKANNDVNILHLDVGADSTHVTTSALSGTTPSSENVVGNVSVYPGNSSTLCHENHFKAPPPVEGLPDPDDQETILVPEQQYRPWTADPNTQHNHTATDKQVHAVVHNSIPIGGDGLLVEATEQKINGERVNEPAVVEQEQMCVCCALKLIFTNYSYSDDNILPPDMLRYALAFLSSSSGLSSSFNLGEMADAEEALDLILKWLHCDCVGAEFEKSQKGMDVICTPPCISHHIFGSQLCDIKQCAKCKSTSDPDTSSSFLYRVYMSELIQLHQQHPKLSFAELLSIEYRRQPYKCPAASAGQSQCNGQAFVQRWCFALPLVFTVMIAWSPDPERDVIQRLFDMLPRIMDLEDILNVPNGKKQAKNSQSSSSTSDSVYHLLGMVLYYGRHYMACFYSDIFGAWVLFDDKRVTKIGNWEHVRERCSRGKLQPTVLFYGSNQEVANRKKFSLESVKHKAEESLQPKNGSEVFPNYFPAAELPPTVPKHTNTVNTTTASTPTPVPAPANGLNNTNIPGTASSLSTSNTSNTSNTSSTSTAPPSTSTAPPLPPRPVKVTLVNSQPDEIDGLFSSLSDDTKFGGYASPRNLPSHAVNYSAQTQQPSQFQGQQPMYQQPGAASQPYGQPLYSQPHQQMYQPPPQQMYQLPPQQMYQPPMYSSPQPPPQPAHPFAQQHYSTAWMCSVCRTTYPPTVPQGHCSKCSQAFAAHRK